MKLLTVIAIMLFANVLVLAQPPPDDWSWTFLRDGETCGLLFEDTNLTASVKAVIRDEVCRSYSFVPSSDRFTKLYVAGDPEYGTFIGRDGTMGNNGGATGLGGWQYKLHNGNRYLHVKKELSAKFLQAIALTNQHEAAIGSLTNFLHAFNSTTTNNVVPSAYLPMWWSLEQDIPLSPSFKRQWEDTPGLMSEATIVQFCGQFCEYEIIFPSILNFRYGDSQAAGGFGCEVVFRRRSDGYYERRWMLTYRAGKWRMVLPEF